MNLLWSESFSKNSSTTFEEDIVIKSILLTHDPDGRDIDSEMLLRLVEYIMHHATPSQEETIFYEYEEPKLQTSHFLSVSVKQKDSFYVSNIEVDGSQEPLIYKTSCEILCKCYEEENADTTALNVLNLLGSYKWEAKLLLLLTAFAMAYGEFWIVTQSYEQNSLAASIALLRHFPRNSNIFNPIFTALASLIKTIVDVVRCVMQFEHLPYTCLERPNDNIKSAKALIYASVYWIVRSIMVCISLIANLGAIKDEQDPNIILITVWEITSLKGKISRIGAQLRTQVDVCQQQTNKEMQKRLINLFHEVQFDNQEVLRMLFAPKNKFPLKQSDKTKIGIDSLKNKVVILLITTTELQHIEDLLFLVHQTNDHPLHSELDGSYEIIWIPISPSSKWTSNEVKKFTFLSNTLPWYSIRQPWNLSQITINFAKEEWRFKEHPIMVVLNSSGRVTNVNAIDMVRIWGAKAYPFSSTREMGLWEKEQWNLKLLLNINDPLLTTWVEEGRTICIYSSKRIDWIRKFSAEIKDIQRLDSQLKVVYVGNNNQSEVTRSIISIIDREKLSHFLSLTKTYYFWHRLESMRRSKLNLGKTIETDHILREVETLLCTNEEEINNEEWIIIGTGSSANMVKLRAKEWTGFLDQSPTWKKYLPKIGLIDTIRLLLEPRATEPCSHSKIVRYSKEQIEEKVCDTCKRPVEKFIMYDVVN